jgi:hypothetical protein
MRRWHFADDQILVLRSVLQDCGIRAGIVSCKLGTSRTGNNKLQESDEAKLARQGMALRMKGATTWA